MKCFEMIFIDNIIKLKTNFTFNIIKFEIIKTFFFDGLVLVKPTFDFLNLALKLLDKLVQ